MTAQSKPVREDLAQSIKMELFGSGVCNESQTGWKVASPVVKTGKTILPHGKADYGNSGLIGRHLRHFLSAVEDAFRMRPTSDDERKKMFTKWEIFIGKESIEATMKWFYASLFSTIGDQVLPSLWGIMDQTILKKNLNFMMGGSTRIGRFMRMMLLVNKSLLKSGGSRKRHRAMTIASTLANLKKGSPSPSEEVVNATMVKHRDAMKNRSAIREVAPLKGVVSDKLIESTIESIVREVFSDQHYSPSTFEHSSRTFKDVVGFPSINGHFEVSRGHAGAAEFIRGDVLHREDDPDFHPHLGGCSYRDGNELDSMTYHPHLGVSEIRGIKVNPLVDKFLGTQRVFNSKPAFILEPLKVRTVTSGPSLEYFVVKPIQKFLWGVMKDHPTFRFIGEPASADYLTKFFMNRRTSGSPNWLSGDYTAATDNLRKRFSQCAWNSLAKFLNMEEWVRRLGSNCLVGHRIWYPDGVVVDQENGQLMGSPLSFPILCIVNAAICKLAYELGDWSSDGMELRDCPILVNGDDCVMDFNHSQKSYWEQISAQVGLSPSIGKCYYAKGWLQINSTNFLMAKDGSFSEVPYINFSLASRCKSKGDEERHWTGIGAAARAFIAGFDKTEQERLLTIFIRRQRDLLKEAPTGMSWWLPQCLGGLGLPIIKATDFIVGPRKTVEKFKKQNLTRRNITVRQFQLAYYLKALLDSGKQTFKANLPTQVAGWVNEGMRKAQRFEIAIPQLPFESFDEELKSRSEWREVANGSPISSFMWEALGNSVDSDSVKPDLLLCAKSWYEVWNKSKLTAYRKPNFREIMLYRPPKYCLPGGLDTVYRRSVDARPVGLMSQISACFAMRSFGIAGVSVVDRRILRAGE